MRYLHSVIADQNELKEAKDWLTDKQTNKPSKSRDPRNFI